ncbi:MAG: carboxypeptidase-like regulatory domain-containing protein, partial [Verrucomicrobiota bacterium]
EILPLPDGSFMLAGISDSNISGDKSRNSQGGDDFWLLLIDADGNRIWDKTIGGSFPDRLRAATRTADGGYLLAGTSNSSVSGDKTVPSNGVQDYWVVRIDAVGNILWQRSYGGTASEFAVAIKTTPDGGFVVGGYSSSNIGGNKTTPSRGSFDFWIVRGDANGNQLWDRTFGSSDADLLSDLAITPDGGVVLAGSSGPTMDGDRSEPPLGLGDCWIIKTDPNGNKIWDRTIGDTFPDGCRSIKPIPGGGYMMLAVTQTPVNQPVSTRSLNDYWLVQLDEDGTVIRDLQVGGNNDDRPVELTITSSSNILLAGHSLSPVSDDKTAPLIGGYDFWAIMVEANNTFHGRVTACEGQSISGAHVNLFDESFNLLQTDGTMGSYYTHGNVPNGTYYLSAVHPNQLTTWYGDVTSMTQAVPLTVSMANPLVNADITMRPGQEPAHVSVSSSPGAAELYLNFHLSMAELTPTVIDVNEVSDRGFSSSTLQRLPR